MSSINDEEGRTRKAFNRGREWFRLAKGPLVKKASQFGQVEDLWKSLEEESDHIESTLRRESPKDYWALLEQVEQTADWLWSMDPEQPNDYWHEPVVEASLFTTTSTGTMSTLTSYPLSRPKQWESLQAAISGFTESQNHRTAVANLLSELSSELKNHFEQAWQTWHSGTVDPRKLAMYGMRDTLLDTVNHLSDPGCPFRGQNDAERREKRVEWIADNLVSDAKAKQLLRSRARRYTALVGYKGLSKAHESDLDEDKAFALLIEAQTFLLELLKTLDWNIVKAKGLCS